MVVGDPQMSCVGLKSHPVAVSHSPTANQDHSAADWSGQWSIADQNSAYWSEQAVTKVV